MITAVNQFDARVKPIPFPGFGNVTRYQYITRSTTLSLDKIKECLNAKMPPMATAAKYLYPDLKPDAATARLHGKIRNLQGRKLNAEELSRLSDIVIKLRRV